MSGWLKKNWMLLAAIGGGLYYLNSKKPPTSEKDKQDQATELLKIAADRKIIRKDYAIESSDGAWAAWEEMQKMYNQEPIPTKGGVNPGDPPSVQF